MAIYDLHIASARPVWPTLQVMSGRSYKRRDAAFRALRAAIVEAVAGAGLQYQSIAKELLQWADDAESSGALSSPGWVVKNKAAGFAFVLARRG
jgi:hypothetical protein